MSPPLPLIIGFVIHAIIAMILIVLLWKKDEKVFRKIIWSLIILVPLLGPLSCGALFNPLSNKIGNKRRMSNSDAANSDLAREYFNGR